MFYEHLILSLIQIMPGYVVDPKNPPEHVGIKGDVGWPGVPGPTGPKGIRVS